MKKTFILLVVMLSCATALSADVNTINAGLKQFLNDLTVTVPNTAVNQNVYADAYIGKLIPSVPAHFAIGVNSAFSTLDTAGLKNAGDVLGLTIPDKLFLPSFTVDARIGGIFLPFDIGFTFMTIPPVNLFDIEVDFLTWGADLRWALMQQSVIKPNISLGIAYHYSTGSMEASNSGATAKISYKMHTIAISAHVSKTFLFVTPFIGGRFMMSNADNTYDWSGNVKGFGNGSVTKSFGDLNQFNLYGGLSFNIFIVRLTPSVSYDFANKVLTGAFSARVQL